ncbi:hypothetical protein KEJ47_06365 [Candidatus Bathyarchaeota archaeon]|nr:hypothetical protein [Candidatus Bathyarchaeota archaeon]
MSIPSGRGEAEWGIALFLAEKTPNPEACLEIKPRFAISKAELLYKRRVCKVEAHGGFYFWST